MFNSYNRSPNRAQGVFALIASLFVMAAHCVVLLIVIGLFLLLGFIAAKFAQSLWMMASHFDALNRHDTLLTALAVLMLALMGLLVLAVARGITMLLRNNQGYQLPWMSLVLLILNIIGAAQLMQIFLDIANYPDNQIYIMMGLQFVLLTVCFGVAFVERRSHVIWPALEQK